MMTRHTAESQRYSPESDELPPRRRRFPAWVTRDMSFKDVALFVIALLAAMGFVNPLGRISKLEHRVDAIEEQQRFNSYLLCVLIRHTDPAAAPPDCIPIIDARKPK